MVLVQSIPSSAVLATGVANSSSQSLSLSEPIDWFVFKAAKKVSALLPVIRPSSLFINLFEVCSIS